MCTDICTSMDKLDFQACSLATTEKESCYIFKAGILIIGFFPWSLVKSQESSFKALGLGFHSLAGKNLHCSVFTTIQKVSVWSM